MDPNLWTDPSRLVLRLQWNNNCCVCYLEVRLMFLKYTKYKSWNGWTKQTIYLCFNSRLLINSRQQFRISCIENCKVLISLRIQFLWEQMRYHTSDASLKKEKLLLKLALSILWKIRLLTDNNWYFDI